MAKSVFNRAVLSKQLLLALRKSMCGNAIVNRNYEGEVTKLNETVGILTPSNVDIRPYSPGTPLTTDEVDGTKQTLTIDSASYFSMVVHDAERVSDSVAAFANEGAYSLADAADQAIMGAVADAGLSVDYDPASDDILAAVREARRVMSVARAPENGRFLVLSPFEVEAVEEKLTGRDTGAGDGVVRRGFQGMLYGFEVYSSGNVTETLVDEVATARHGIFGNRSCITFADGISELETLRSQTAFGDIVRGLHVYGLKVVRPEILGSFDVDLTA